MTAKKAVLLLLVVANLLFLTAMLQEAEALTVEDVSKALICPCGCGKILDGCYCDTAAQMKTGKDGIEQKISEGKTKDQIIAEFQLVYGDQILMTPQKSDLELTLWAFPIIASVIGTVAIYQLARRKATIPDSEVKSPIAETEVEEELEMFETEKDETKKYEEIFEQEYQKFKKDQNEKSDA